MAGIRLPPFAAQLQALDGAFSPMVTNFSAPRLRNFAIFTVQLRAMLSVNNVSMRYGARVLFEDVTCTFMAGRRYAISGPNGATPVVLLTAAAGSLESTKTRPDFVVKKNLGLAVELRAILKQLARSNLQSRAAPAELKERVLKKFFLIDDSREIHVLVGLSFKRFPEIEIVGVLDPTRALESARSETPDLILLDVQMTPVSGKDVMRDIKATPELSDIPVAFFTGNDDAAEKRELASLGAWQIFKKPVSPKTFSDQVLSLFEAR